VKTDTPGFLDLKLVVITKDPAAWLDGLASLGELENEGEQAGWTHRRYVTTAKLRDLTIRVAGYVGPPGADVTVGFVGADRIVTDGTTEIPDVSIAAVKRVAGTPGRETLLGALKEVLKEAASG
jgi:hypothetical protein